MRRRGFIMGIAGSVVLWPPAVHAQQGDLVRRIGVLSGVSASDADAQQRYGIFLERLRQLGWIAGRNLHVDTRWSGGNADDARKSAAELDQQISVSLVRIISGALGKSVGPCVDDRVAIDVVDTSHDAFLELVL